jgi:hypothetical protein
MTMTLWPPQDQADEDVWAKYRRRTARPRLLEEEAAAEQVKQQAVEPPTRRGRVSENPQPEKDA